MKDQNQILCKDVQHVDNSFPVENTFSTTFSKLLFLLMHFIPQKKNQHGQYYCCFVAKLCPALLPRLNCSPPGSSVHGIIQAKILQWVAISFSRGPSWPRDQTHVSCIGRWTLYYYATREANNVDNRLQQTKKIKQEKAVPPQWRSGYLSKDYISTNDV